MQVDLKDLLASPGFQAVANSVRDFAIFLLDPDGTVLTWNTGAQQIKGYEASEIIGQSFTRFYTEQDRAAGFPQSLLAEAATSGRVEEEGWRVRKDGSRFWADVVISRLGSADCAVIGFVKVTRDLTERRLTEEALRQSEERARLTVASVKDYAIFMLDTEGRITSWNAGAERAKGYRAVEVMGRHFSLFFTPEDLASGKPGRLLRAAAEDERVEDQGWRIRKDGSRFWADVVISRVDDDAGNLIGFTKVTRDLTDRRHAEEQLRQSEERLRLMFESVTDYAIFMLDPRGRVVSWNPGAERLKGYAAGEIIGEHFSRFYLPEDVRAGKPELELQIASSIGRFEEEGWRVRKDGSRFWAGVVLTQVRNPEGILVGFAKVTRDLTDRKRAVDDESERARQQAAVSELGLFALRTPELAAVMERAVRTVMKTLQIDDVRIHRDDDRPPPGATSVSIHGLVRRDGFGLLSASSPRPLSVNDFNFLQAVANVISTAIARAQLEEQLRGAERNAIEERGRTIQAQEALRQRDEFISVAAHELRTPLTALQLKLQSLERTENPDRRLQRLGGAVRQTERLSRLIDRLLDVSRVAQGRVEMAPERFDLSALVHQVADDFREPALEARAPLDLNLPDKTEGCWDRLRLEQVLVNLLSNAVKYGAGNPISVSLEADVDKVRLRVIDRGIGIAPDDVDRIFLRFQRAAPIRNYGGLGLGLYISRYIVEAHRGTIAVDSKIDEGSTFLIELPRWSGPVADQCDRTAGARA